jgi:Protein of unknown function (DUF1593)
MTVPLHRVLCFLGLLLVVRLVVAQSDAKPSSGPRPRVLISTDVGGTDPDDFQSLVHLLVYADCFDLEGLVSSPYGPGRKEHILQVIDCYAHDYTNLKTYSASYPSPDALRVITKQGALQTSGPSGFGTSTEGSDWIVRVARRDEERPLHVLVWGGIDDLAQALHDAPEILPKLRVYFIGGPNKMWSVNAYDYIEDNHPTLWIIEANATYRGWFVGGNQTGDWGNKSFVDRHVAGHGALSDFFAKQLNGTLKMGDSPSVGWLLRGTPADPSQPSWGGQFVRVWDGRKTIFRRLTAASDHVEVFGVVEFELPVPQGITRERTAKMIFDSRITVPMENDGRVLRCRFSPRDAKVWSYVVQSDFASLDGQAGTFTAVPPAVERTRRASVRHPNWWVDDPDPTTAEGIHPGAKSVSRWREEILAGFAARLLRCSASADN